MTPKRILIVEDEPAQQKALVDALTRAGYKTLTAGDGLSGLELARREHPDLILLDIVMPKVDGLTLLKEVRQEDKWGESVPVILLTNLSEDQKAAREASSQYTAYMLKTDWKLEDVVAQVGQMLAGHEHPATE